ncbi:hypothetical protein DASC09_016780 [Saccharomycopsis crataegensis]|uniref:NAD-dependent epimerase/dehydratase domain-containing protein n=1 Tax=Saccharomycopsis crataegensis TaxID=43959 RepID=A0AAV5QHM2_9ASCO|nr:hypothetical protein DASC09_016780 [Saccharomycopsis crataegensis]
MLRTISASKVQPVNTTLKRSIYTNVLKSDINITKAGKTNITVGSGGRSSRTGYTATVFGASGFLGRYLVSKLARHGTLTVVPYRDDMKKRFLKVCGDLGVVNFVEFDLRNLKSIEDSVKHSDIVFNCIGAEANTKNFSMADVNIEGARRVAQAVKDYGVPRYVHVSSHSADVNSKSIFYATKGIGEQVVREIIPETTIVRPGVMFGREDKLLNRLGDAKNLFTVNHSKETVIPTHVHDVAKAMELIGFDDSTAGKLYELNGPETFSIHEIRELIKPFSKIDYRNINLPKPVALKIAELLQYAWWPLVNPDQIERQFMDQVVTPGTLGFKDLGLTPESLSDHLFTYTYPLRNYLHSHDLPPTPKQVREMKKYVHILE